VSIVKLHKGAVTKGKFRADNELAFKVAFAKHEGKRVCVIVDRETKKRSSGQNSYYWGVIIELISEWTGYTKDETHDMLRGMFLRKRKEGLPDTIRSTTELSTVEMEEYHESIRRWGAEQGVYIPAPNEVGLG
jgi:hypothetical protein